MVLGLGVVEAILEATKGTTKKIIAQWNFLLPTFASSLLQWISILRKSNRNPNQELSPDLSISDVLCVC